MRLSHVLSALSVCWVAVRVAVGQTAPIGSASLYAGLVAPYDVATDSTGAVYIADQSLQAVIKTSATGGSPLVYYNATSSGSSTAIKQPDGFCLDSAMNVYVVDSGNSRVVKYNNAGVQQLIIASTAGNPALQYPWNCAVDSNNNLFVSNTVGQGVNKFDVNGVQIAYLNNTSPAFAYPNQIALNAAGTSVFVADSNNNRIVQIDSSTGAQQQNFPLPAGAFANGVAVDGQGNVYVTETSLNLVIVYNSAGQNTLNLTTSTNPGFAAPRGIWVDAQNNVFIADTYNMRIFKFYSSTSGYTGGFGGGTNPTSPAVNGYSVKSVFGSLSFPYDVALDSSNNMYVADWGNNRVVKLAAGSTGNTVAQTYTATNPSILQPDGLCLDSANNVYIMDSGNSRIVELSNTGSAVKVFPNTSGTPAFSYPWNCAVDSTNNIYVSNTNAQGVNKISASGSQAAFLANTLSPALQYPNQVALDSTGALYIADSNGARAVKVDGTSGALITAYPMPANSFPNGVTVDSNFNVYVSDTTQSSIYMFNNAGTLLMTFAIKNDQPLNNPRGLAVNSNGDLYVADANNNRIVIFQNGTGTVSPSGAVVASSSSSTGGTNTNAATLASRLSNGLVMATVAVAAALALLF